MAWFRRFLQATEKGERKGTNRDEDDMYSDDSSERVDSFDDMKELELEMQLGVICVDQIVETHNKQDRLAVCNIFEALIAFLKRRLPMVR